MKKAYCISGAFWDGRLRIRTAHIIKEINDKQEVVLIKTKDQEEKDAVMVGEEGWNAICQLSKTNVYYTYREALKAARLAQNTYKEWLSKGD